MDRKLGLIYIVILGSLLAGCSLFKEEEIIVKGDISQLIEDRDSEEETTSDLDLGLGDGKRLSPLSGLEVEDREVRPVSIMFDNHPRARWQAGLSGAEIVYEFPVEAPYTRYMGVYLKNMPSQVGPIRSARPYFINKALELDSLYVHVGGSERAKSDIKRFGLLHLDGLENKGGIFKRKKHKKMPHNLYSSLGEIRGLMEELDYRTVSEREFFKFGNPDGFSGQPAQEIFIDYLRGNTTAYSYDSEEGNYRRYKDGVLHIDELDQEPIRADNIIIQRAKVAFEDGEGRLAIDLSGRGDGFYIRDGSYREIEWTKAGVDSRTVYSYKDNEEIILKPGVTWIQVVDPGWKLEFKGRD